MIGSQSKPVNVSRKITAILAIAVLTVIAFVGLTHTSHHEGNQQDCVICQLRHQPVTALAGSTSLDTTVWFEADTITHTDYSRNSYSGKQDPTRGPPA